MKTQIDTWFKRLVIINLMLIFVVILAGSIVRVTGSGMGCPDWPTCFGKLIPPTSADEVSWFPNKEFQEGEMVIHQEKLLVAQSDFKTAGEFVPLNWEEYPKHDYAIFNPLHTWIEFINRLATVVLGFPVMAMFGLSLFYWKDRRARTFLSFAVVFLVGFQAWLGKLVVDNNLQGSTITYHMIGVFAIIGVLLILRDKTNRTHGETTTPEKLFSRLSSVSIYLTLLMVVMGTQVREQIDKINEAGIPREFWITNLDWMYILHRSLIWVIVALNGYLIYKAYENNWYKNRWTQIGIVIVLQAIIGVLFVYMDFPKVAQPLHLFLSAILFALQFDLLIKLRAPKAILYG